MFNKLIVAAIAACSVSVSAAPVAKMGGDAFIIKRQDALLSPVAQALGGVKSVAGMKRDGAVEQVTDKLAEPLDSTTTGWLKRQNTLEEILSGLESNQDLQGALSAVQSQSQSQGISPQSVEPEIGKIVEVLKSTTSSIQSADTNSDHSALGLLVSGQLYNIVQKLSPLLDKLGEGLGLEDVIKPLDAELLGLIKSLEPAVANIEQIVGGLLSDLGLGPLGDLLHNALERGVPTLLAGLDHTVLSKLNDVPVVGSLLEGLGL
ncbi:hypothetical protein E3Q19_03972 [Wallemia mellicola]|nr:hypothetical protein E3Q19_03972 [Wallemia mellicola]TIC72444.1 hypothetical protein E3Q00_03983 [Wallemia mellicola]